MSQRLCRAGCLYAIDGRCRLEHRPDGRGPVCPFFEKDIPGYYGGTAQ